MVFGCFFGFFLRTGDEALAKTELRDFIAAINDGSFAFDSGSILDSDGDMYAPASMEEPLTARPYQVFLRMCVCVCVRVRVRVCVRV